MPGDSSKALPHPAVRLLVVLVAPLLAAELLYQLDASRLPGPLWVLISDWVARYAAARAVIARYWPLALLFGVLTFAVALWALRAAMLLWRNVVLARLSGTATSTSRPGFRKRRFDLAQQLQATPRGSYFIGLDPQGSPVLLDELDLDTHGHIMGHTGSGKTKSVLAPLMYQDMRAGKGVLFMDAKGGADNVELMRGMANATGRLSQLKILSLTDPASHTYNPVHLGPAADPLAVAERVFSVFNLEHEYYRGQSKLFFYGLMQVLAGTGVPFNLVDVRMCVADPDALNHVIARSDERRAAYSLQRQLKQLGSKSLETFTGLVGALAEYEHPLLNSYNPDIVLEDIVDKRGLVYFNLPANLYTLLAPAVGKIALQHVKTLGALRQIDRARYDQTPFSVNIDELNRFAFDELVPSLAMLRDARIQFRLAHQSIGDLEQVSDVFARQVKDNTRWKLFLFENDAEHLERIAKSYGTRTTYKRTVRYALGPLFTFLNTGEVSHREVEEFVLHPNELKCLAPRGQAYLLLPDGRRAVNLEMLPDFPKAKTALPRNPPKRGLNLEAKMLKTPAKTSKKPSVAGAA